MTKEQICILIAMAVYMIAVVVIGVICARRNRTADDFYLGGRKLGPLVTAMSAEASDMSSWLLMGLPGLAYLTGISDAGWTAIGLAVGTYVNWLVVSKRLRRYTVVAKNSITLPDFFSNRYGDKYRILMCVSALVILVFFVPYTASGFAACGKLFNSLFDVPYVGAMVVSAVVIVAYTAIGGFLAASTTDLMQGILMSVALVVVLVFGVVTAGGFGAAASADCTGMAAYDCCHSFFICIFLPSSSKDSSVKPLFSKRFISSKISLSTIIMPYTFQCI